MRTAIALVLVACVKPVAPPPIAHRADRTTQWRFVDESTEPSRRETTTFTLDRANGRATLDIERMTEVVKSRETFRRSRRYVGTVRTGPKIEIAVTATTQYDEENPYEGSSAAYEITLACELTVLQLHPRHAQIVPPHHGECADPVGTWNPPGTVPHDVLVCDVPSHGRWVFAAAPGVMQRRFAGICENVPLGGLRRI